MLFISCSHVPAGLLVTEKNDIFRMFQATFEATQFILITYYLLSVTKHP